MRHELPASRLKHSVGCCPGRLPQPLPRTLLPRRRSRVHGQAGDAVVSEQPAAPRRCTALRPCLCSEKHVRSSTVAAAMVAAADELLHPLSVCLPSPPTPSQPLWLHLQQGPRGRRLRHLHSLRHRPRGLRARHAALRRRRHAVVSAFCVDAAVFGTVGVWPPPPWTVPLARCSASTASCCGECVLARLPLCGGARGGELCPAAGPAAPPPLPWQAPRGGPQPPAAKHN